MCIIFYVAKRKHSLKSRVVWEFFLCCPFVCFYFYFFPPPPVQLPASSYHSWSSDNILGKASSLSPSLRAGAYAQNATRATGSLFLAPGKDFQHTPRAPAVLARSARRSGHSRARRHPARSGAGLGLRWRQAAWQSRRWRQGGPLGGFSRHSAVLRGSSHPRRERGRMGPCGEQSTGAFLKATSFPCGRKRGECSDRGQKAAGSGARRK